MTIKAALIPILGAALIGGAVAGVSLTALAAPGTTTATTQAGMKGPMHGGFGPGIAGAVTAVNGSTITVTSKDGGVYTVDASGASVEKYANGASSAIAVANIAVGDEVMINGTIKTATVSAKEIHDGAFPKPAMPAAVGKVTAVSGSSITISGMGKGATQTYTIDASGAAITKITAPAAKGDKPTTATIATSGIAVGDMIAVEGTVNGSAITATKVVDGAGFGAGMHRGFGPGKKQSN